MLLQPRRSVVTPAQEGIDALATGSVKLLRSGGTLELGRSQNKSGRHILWLGRSELVNGKVDLSTPRLNKGSRSNELEEKTELRIVRPSMWLSIASVISVML